MQRSAIWVKLLCFTVVSSLILLADAGASRRAQAQSPRGANDAQEREPEFPQVSVETVNKGSSTRAELKSALESLPLERLNVDQRKRVAEILDNRSMFRRLPTISLECSPDVYEHFTHNPESAVAFWRVMGISKFTMTPQANNVWVGDAGDGSKGVIELLLQDRETNLLLCDGEYRSPVLINPIRARAIMHLRSRIQPSPAGQPVIVHDLDLFVMFPQQSVDTVAKVVSPVSHMIADRNFRELSMFVRFIHLAMENQPGWIERSVQKMDGVSLRQKDELLTLASRLSADSRRAGNDGSAVVPAGLTVPGGSLEPKPR